MTGQLKNVDFFRGRRIPVKTPRDKVVEILEVQNHPIYGIRYKIDHDARDGEEWWEANCFEWIKD